MPRGRHAAAPLSSAVAALALLGVIAASCVYPALTTSSDWDADAPVGGDGSQPSGGVATGGTPGVSAGSGVVGDAGAGAAGPLGGQGGAAIDDGLLHGRVVDQYGAPLAGVVVLIEDVELTSDANGEVSTESPTSPSFRAVVLDATQATAHVYEGLTRRDPYFRLARSTLQDEHEATIEGVINTDAPETNLRIVYQDAERFLTFAGIPAVGAGSPDVAYSVSLNWTGDAMLNGEGMALSWSNGPTGYPETYYFGLSPLTIVDGEARTLDFGTNQIDSKSMLTQVTALPGVTHVDIFSVGPFSPVVVTAGVASATYVVPSGPAIEEADLEPSFSTTCTSPDGFGTTSLPITGLSQVDATCPTPPALGSPLDDADDVRVDTPFSLTPERAGCNTFQLQSATPWSMTIYTLANQVIAPDLEAWGIVWAGAQITWQASTTSPCDSIDNYVAPPAPYEGARPTVVYTQSVQRSFIGAP